MYHLYHTEGFVLKCVPLREADFFCSVFTKELGLVEAEARGVRLLQSKLRPGLLPFSYSDLTLLRGKNVWRIASVRAKENILRILKHQHTRDVFARVFSLLRRLLRGEEENKTLFEHLFAAHEFASRAPLSPKDAPHFEHLLVLRILHSLGYVGAPPEMYAFIHAPQWDLSLLDAVRSHGANVVAEINKSLLATDL